MRVVNRYIGVEGGYLDGFTYRTHHEFYPEYCDLDYDPYEFTGTTRERFIAILSGAPPEDQAKILRGVVERFPVDQEGAPESRTKTLRDELLSWADELQDSSLIASPDLATMSSALERALGDVEALIQLSGAPSAVDRVHTALHAYLEALCRDADIEVPDDAAITLLFKILRKEHPDLQPVGPRSSDITRMLRSIAAIVDALNPVRNRASGAHPNPEVLEPPEAMLVVNLVRTLLNFLNMRIEASVR